MSLDAESAGRRPLRDSGANTTLYPAVSAEFAAAGRHRRGDGSGTGCLAKPSVRCSSYDRAARTPNGIKMLVDLVRPMQAAVFFPGFDQAAG